jgi:DNA-binding Lrp family transcriptional regulator
MNNLSAFDKRLCNELQIGLPIAERPFAIIARILKSSEAKVLERTRALIKLGVIRRLGVSINWRAIGKASTLVAAHIEQEDLKKVISAVNKLRGVSHNYLREHYYNLWFTLRADSQRDIDAILKKLSKHFGVRFNTLPVERVFKLDARFDATSGGKRLLPALSLSNGPARYRCPLNAERCPPALSKVEGLSSIDEQILKGLQEGLKVVKRPFNFLGKDAFENYDALIHIAEMIHSGVINRLGAMVNHNKLSFTANAMFVCKAKKSRAIKIGEKLAALGIVSHCYERKRFKGWPYNIFGMMHGRDMRDIWRVVERFVRSQGLKKWQLLPTADRIGCGYCRAGFYPPQADYPAEKY